MDVMRGLGQAAGMVARPAQQTAKALTRPTTAGRNVTVPGLGVLRTLRGADLEQTLRGRIVLLTGASSGIGEATAHRIGRANGEVVLVARGAEKLERTAWAVNSAGGRAHVYPCDLTDLDAVGELAERVQSDLGHVDVLINNAGKSIRRSLELSYERFHDFQRTMQLNYFAPVRLMLGLLPGMRERHFGRIVNVSSIGVLTRVPRFGAYIASKAALDTLCDSWQAETAHENVRFTTVHMALVRTPMISATTIYDRFPVLTPEEAAGIVTRAIVHTPRRVSPPVGSFAAFADAITPEIMDRIRNLGYQLFEDSSAARGEASPEKDRPIGAERRMFAEITRGVHW
jgi:NAD(P)-dependent dehydrogenase (short-subunit alcohol dehydrogenase family)